ncbi:hypothetical protein BG015_000080 [Linnemannia schmuckeri]|uniref:Uncharacterized protein n=1 Tax=Linnemannia schmuckeri TaxID=64567 RepID=A0A9P5RRJ5_9FUNG|nr:hypothetical protein BG015_000080 [Linnemannia schmuckeri]
MPVSVNDPFLLASFSSTTHHHQQQQAVSCSPEERDTTPANYEEDSGLLVVAVQGEGVQLYNTADQKCILSYSTPPGYSFAGSAQTLHKSTLRHVYAVVAKGTDVTAKDEGKIVWMWKEESSTPSSVAAAADSDMAVDTVKPSSARKAVHKFDHKIHQLFVSALLPNHIILANADASISLVTGDLKRVINTKELLIAPTTTTTTTKASKKDKKDTTLAQDNTGNMVWASSFNTTGSWISSNALARQTLVIMTIVESANDKLTVTLSYVNEEHRGFSTFGSVELETAPGASGFAFDVKTGQFSFLTADGHLKVYNFEVTPGNHALSARETLTLPLPGYAASSAPAPAAKAGKKGAKVATVMDSKVDRVDAVALGDNYLAVAGIHQINGKAEHTLTIWDIQYGTLQAKHVVPGNFTAQNTTCQLALLPDSTLVMTISTLINTTIKSEVYLCPFYAEPMSLLGAMGKMRDTAPFLGQQGSILAQDAYTLTTTSLLTPSGLATIVKGKDLLNAGADLDKQLNAAQSAERTALASLASESKTSTVQDFEKVFFNHVEHQTADAVSDRLARHNVDGEKVKAAVQAEQEWKANKVKTSQDMDVDTEPVAKTVAEAPSSKKAKKAAKAAAKAAKETKETKDDKKAHTEEEGAGGSSSESSSDEDEDDEEVIVLSSDEEKHDEADVEEEDEYEVDEYEERTKREANQKAIETWRRIEAAAAKKYKGDRRLLRVGRKHAPLPELSHHFLTTVVGRCFATLANGQPDMSFWPAKVVEYLIKNQLVGNSNPGAGEGGIALGLMEREQWPLLELALQKLYDIPEMDMVVMMKQVIGLNKQQSSAAATTTKTSISVPNVASFLNTIMVAPRNDVFMQQAIKRFTVEELAIILEILKEWIIIWDQRGGLGHQNQRPDKKQLPGGLPGYALLVDMTTLILDVHFPSLILSPHLHPVLKTIQEAIQREAEASNLLEQSLRGALGLFDRKHHESMARKKDTPAAAANAADPSTSHGGPNDKRRRRKWVGGEGIQDYAVEIIHL